LCAWINCSAISLRATSFQLLFSAPREASGWIVYVTL
jgi:hypothetical protein